MRELEVRLRWEMCKGVGESRRGPREDLGCGGRCSRGRVR